MAEIFVNLYFVSGLMFYAYCWVRGLEKEADSNYEGYYMWCLVLFGAIIVILWLPLALIWVYIEHGWKEMKK